MRDMAEARIREIVAGISSAHGAHATVDYDRNYPITVNDANEADFCAAVAAEIVGPHQVDTDIAPMMAGEDFSYMLERKPGAYVFIGNGGQRQPAQPRL